MEDDALDFDGLMHDHEIIVYRYVLDHIHCPPLFRLANFCTVPLRGKVPARQKREIHVCTSAFLFKTESALARVSG